MIQKYNDSYNILYLKKRNIYRFNLQSLENESWWNCRIYFWVLFALKYGSCRDIYKHHSYWVFRDFKMSDKMFSKKAKFEIVHIILKVSDDIQPYATNKTEIHNNFLSFFSGRADYVRYFLDKALAEQGYYIHSPRILPVNVERYYGVGNFWKLQRKSRNHFV